MHSFYLCLLLFPFQLCFASGTMAVTIDSLCHRFFSICSGVALDSKRNQMCLVRHNSPFFSTRKWKVLWICVHFLLNLRSNNAIQGYFFFNMNCGWMLDVWRWLMLNITNKICAQNAILTFPNISLAFFSLSWSLSMAFRVMWHLFLFLSVFIRSRIEWKIVYVYVFHPFFSCSFIRPLTPWLRFYSLFSPTLFITLLESARTRITLECGMK